MLNNVYPSVIILHGKEQVKKCIIVQGSKIGSFLTGFESVTDNSQIESTRNEKL